MSVGTIEERRTYPGWADATLDEEEAGMPTDKADNFFAFVMHLKNIGADWRDPGRYGWPMAVQVTMQAVPILPRDITAEMLT